MEFMEVLVNRVKQNPKRIVFAEGENENIIKAACLAAERKFAYPILIGNIEKIHSKAETLGANLSGISLIQVDGADQFDAYVQAYCENREMPERVGQRFMRQRLYFAAMMVKQGDADGMIAGIDHATEEVIMATELIIGLQEGISVISSFYVMDIPGFQGGEEGLLIFADPAVNPNPTAEQLADIAISTAGSAASLMGWQPRVVMLSFSTRGSASHPLVEKVSKAVAIAREKAPGLLLDGEMQADTAIVEAVAARKIEDGSDVAGKANVLIFPDLNAANISSKLVQRLAKAKAYGPLLQGSSLPVSDLSRGASVDDIVGAVILLAARG